MRIVILSSHKTWGSSVFGKLKLISQFCLSICYLRLKYMLSLLLLMLSVKDVDRLLQCGRLWRKRVRGRRAGCFLCYGSMTKAWGHDVKRFQKSVCHYSLVLVLIWTWDFLISILTLYYLGREQWVHILVR